MNKLTKLVVLLLLTISAVTVQIAPTFALDEDQMNGKIIIIP
jgi:hypothetical protein